MAYNGDYLGGPNYLGSLGAGKIYMYDTADALAVVLGANYFADGKIRGLEKGDVVFVRIFDNLTTKANLLSVTILYVSAVGATAATAVRKEDGISTATAAAGAATLNALAGKITSESLTTAAAAAYTLTLTNSMIAAGDIVWAKVGNGTNSAGIPIIGTVAEAAGSVVIKVENQHASAAFNGTVVVSFSVSKA